MRAFRGVSGRKDEAAIESSARPASGRFRLTALTALGLIALGWGIYSLSPPSEDKDETASSAAPALTSADVAPAGDLYLYELSTALEAAAAERRRSLAAALAPLIKSEPLAPDHLNRSLGWLKNYKAANEFEKNLIHGAEAFLFEDYQSAEFFFRSARLLNEDDIYLPSFLAAAALKSGETGRAEDLYLKALVLKSEQGLSEADLSSDQLGLALSLFMLGRPEEALPLAEHSWKNRNRILGPAHPETLAAANRLAAIMVALGRNGPAEELLTEAYQAAVGNAEITGESLAETRLLLSVLFDQSGRLEELAAFFDSAEPQDLLESDQGEKGRPSEAAAPEAGQASEDLARQLAEWRNLAEALRGHDDQLAADLRRHIVQSRMKEKGFDPLRDEFRSDILKLIEASAAAGRYEQAEAEALILMKGAADQNSAEFFQLADLLAQSLKGQGKTRQAEAWWQEAVEPIDRRLLQAKEKGASPEASDVDKSLDLHLKIADLFLLEGRTPREAEIELKASLGRLPKNQAEAYPKAAEVYLNLARLFQMEGQISASADYYRRAQRTALELSRSSAEPEIESAPQSEQCAVIPRRPQPDKRRSGDDSLSPRSEDSELNNRLTFLENIAKQAGSELEALESGQARPLGKTAFAPPEPPQPELLQRQYLALKTLGRVSEFEDRLAPALDEAARLYGSGDPRYMVYLRLKLKSLEESGRIDDLTAELLNQAQSPPGRNEAEKILNQASALIYAASANEKAGRPAEAAALYQRALESAEGRREKAIAARRAMAEAGLRRLKGQ